MQNYKKIPKIENNYVKKTINNHYKIRPSIYEGLIL